MADTDRTDAYWVWHFPERKDRSEMATEYDVDGKWMVFSPKEDMASMWERAKAAFDSGLLTGVIGMKASTRKPNPRASSQDDGVIILYSGNSKKMEETLDIGRRIAKVLKYMPRTGVMYWKSDVQTFEGTRATGTTHNHTFALRVEPEFTWQ